MPTGPLEIRRVICHQTRKDSLIFQRHQDRCTRVIVENVEDLYLFGRSVTNLRHYAEHLKGLFDFCATPGKDVVMSWDIASKTAEFLKETI